MNVAYTILTSIAIQHDYYADGRSEDFILVPTTETKSILSGAGVIAKMVGNTLLLLTRVGEDGSMYIPIITGQRLRFYLQLQNTNFAIFTNFDVQNGAIGYFSNVPATAVGSIPYLGTKTQNYSSSITYKIGEMVGHNNNIYEAIKPISAGANTPPSPAFWHLRTGAQYASSIDNLPIVGQSVKLSSAASKNFNIGFFALNPLTLVYDQQVAEPMVKSYESEIRIVEIPLDNIPDGKLKIRVNGTDHFIYKDQQALYSRAYGIVELHNVYGSASDHGWLLANGVPKETEHVLRFANRLTIWKYITKTTNATKIEMQAAPNSFTAGALAKQFVSTRPLPLHETPIKTISLYKNDTLVVSKLPNAPPSRMATHLDGDGNNYLCSEMYISY